MKRFLNQVKNIIKKLLFVVIILIICVVILGMVQGKHPKFFGYQFFRVLTSSMQPAISESTCIITKEVAQEDLKVGDIITFISEDPDIYGFYNTHRIYEMKEEGGEVMYITKGDANPNPDEHPVPYSNVAGILVCEMPGGRIIGEIFILLSNSTIYFLVIMLPLVICLLSYIWQIIGYVTNRYDDEEEDDEEDNEIKEIEITDEDTAIQDRGTAEIEGKEEIEDTEKIEDTEEIEDTEKIEDTEDI